MYHDPDFVSSGPEVMSDVDGWLSEKVVERWGLLFFLTLLCRLFRGMATIGRGCGRRWCRARLCCLCWTLIRMVACLWIRMCVWWGRRLFLRWGVIRLRLSVLVGRVIILVRLCRLVVRLIWVMLMRLLLFRVRCRRRRGRISLVLRRRVCRFCIVWRWDL